MKKLKKSLAFIVSISIDEKIIVKLTPKYD